jgi:hypothetical protein
MAENGVQYRRRLPLLEFLETYGTQERCGRGTAMALARGFRFICPRCYQSWHSEFRRSGRLYFQCSSCRYERGLISCAIFDSSKRALPKWFAAIQLIRRAKNTVSALELMRQRELPRQVRTCERTWP